MYIFLSKTKFTYPKPIPIMTEPTNQLLDLGPGDSTDVAGLGSLGLGSRERPAWQGVKNGQLIVSY